jgi:hypothetical protein
MAEVPARSEDHVRILVRILVVARCPQNPSWNYQGECLGGMMYGLATSDSKGWAGRKLDIDVRCKASIACLLLSGSKCSVAWQDSGARLSMLLSRSCTRRAVCTSDLAAMGVQFKCMHPAIHGRLQMGRTTSWQSVFSGDRIGSHHCISARRFDEEHHAERDKRNH